MDEIGGAKGLGNCRIYFQNIGTLPIGKDRYEAEEAVGILRRAEVDVVGLTEVNKNEQNTYVRRECGEIIKKAMEGAEFKVGSNVRYEARGIRKPGGIMTIVSRRMKNTSKVETDYLGRWSRTQVRREKGLVIYTVYIPSDVDLGGPSTVRRKLQHETDKREEYTHWKDEFYGDLMREINRERE